jgi:Ca-activated chloride channel family protein
MIADFLARWALLVESALERAPWTLDVGAPGALLLLFLLPLWWVLLWPRAGHGLVLARAGAAKRRGWGIGVLGGLVLALPRILRSGALLVLVLALSDPERVEQRTEVSVSGRGIALAVDLSSSMLARDMEGGASRIEVAREAAIRFAEGRPLDEQTLVGFAAQPVTRVPPTLDPKLITAGVESLEVQLVRDGTDISGAVLTAAARLLDSDREPRVVVLLTDGAHNGVGVPPLAAARALATLGLRVHAISLQGPESRLSTPSTRAAPARDPSARIALEMRTVLEGMASITGGRYFHASSGEALDSIYREIDRMEAPVLESTTRELRHPLRAWLLAMALVLIASEALLRGSRWGVLP